MKAMKIIDKRLKETSDLINKHIDRIVKDNRADESVEIISHLRIFCETVFYKIYDEENNADLYQTHENLKLVRKYISDNYPKFNIFHQFLDCGDHVLFGIEQSEAIVIKYVPYLIDIKIFLKNNYCFDVLESINKYPLNLEDSLVKLYRSIIFALNSCAYIDLPKSKDLYYVRKKTLKYLDNQIFYEYVLDISDDKPSKFSTVVAYSKLNIDFGYDLNLKFLRKKIKFLETNVDINIIYDFDISIRPCSFNTIGEMYKFDLKITSRTKSYLELMDTIKNKKCSLLDLIEDRSFCLSNKDSYSTFMDNVRSFIFNKKFGYKLLKLMLLNMRYSFIKGQINKRSFDDYKGGRTLYNPYFNKLKISSGSLGFENNPIALSPLIEQPSLSDLARIVDLREYKHEILYKEIKNYINTNNSLFIEPKDIPYDNNELEELINRYNSCLYGYRSEYQIIKVYDKLTIKFYYEASLNVIKIASKLNKKANAVINYIKDDSVDLSDDKIFILEHAFKASSICLVTGAAGTGKTRLIHEYIKNNLDKSILCLTTTNTAKNNLKNDYGVNVEYLNSAEYLLKGGTYDFVVVDEATFVPTETMSKLFTENQNSCFLIVGDPYQIESIEFGNWFKLLLSVFAKSGFIYSLDADHRAKTKELQKVWDVVRNINGGENKILELMSAFNFAKTITQDAFSVSDNQVMLCLNYDGLYGINNLNRYLEANNPNEEFLFQQNVYKIGDPVVFVINDFQQYGLYNNIHGIITNIVSTDNFIEFKIKIDNKISKVSNIYITSEIQIDNTGDNSIVTVKKNRTSIDDYDTELLHRSKLPFQLAYAMSIHKAQGLEFEKVKIIITSDTEEYISKNIFYTAITRAKNLLEVYWDPEVPQKIFTNMIEESKSSNRDIGVFQRLINEGSLVI